MRLSPAIIASTEEALREVLRFAGPADVVLSRYFRDHPRLGGRERGMIAEATYALLRRRHLYNHLSESGSGPQMRKLALLGLSEAAGIDALSGLTEAERAWLDNVMAIDRSRLPVALRANMPDWIMSRLIQQFGEDEAMQLTDTLNQPAPLDLRVNTIKSDRETAEAALTYAGIVCMPTPFSSLGLRMHKKPALQNMTIFKDGHLEVQDEGSQLLAQILGAKRGEMVADFCAGAGGKTLALGAWMRNTGRLYAFDVSEKRLAKLKPRLARSGLSNVHPVLIAHENDAKVKRLAGKIDRVLVDAPCSGRCKAHRPAHDRSCPQVALPWHRSRERSAQDVHLTDRCGLGEASALPSVFRRHRTHTNAPCFASMRLAQASYRPLRRRNQRPSRRALRLVSAPATDCPHPVLPDDHL